MTRTASDRLVGDGDSGEPGACAPTAFCVEGREYVLLELAVDADTFDPRLTPAEREVFSALVAGMKARAIADQRESSHRTVERQISDLYRKLGVSSRSELLRRARGTADR